MLTDPLTGLFFFFQVSGPDACAKAFGTQAKCFGTHVKLSGAYVKGPAHQDVLRKGTIYSF